MRVSQIQTRHDALLRHFDVGKVQASQLSAGVADVPLGLVESPCCLVAGGLPDVPPTPRLLPSLPLTGEIPLEGLEPRLLGGGGGGAVGGALIRNVTPIVVT